MIARIYCFCVYAYVVIWDFIKLFLVYLSNLVHLGCIGKCILGQSGPFSQIHSQFVHINLFKIIADTQLRYMYMYSVNANYSKWKRISSANISFYDIVCTKYWWSYQRCKYLCKHGAYMHVATSFHDCWRQQETSVLHTYLTEPVPTHGNECMYVFEWTSLLHVCYTSQLFLQR